jgi:hypothetical protein
MTDHTLQSVILTLVLLVAGYMHQVSACRSYCTGNQLLTLHSAHSRTQCGALVATLQKLVTRTPAQFRIRFLTALHIKKVPTLIYLFNHLKHKSPNINTAN